MLIIQSVGVQSTEMAAITVNQRVLPVVKGMVLLAYYSYCQKVLLADNKAEVVKVMEDMRKAVSGIGIRPYALDAVWNELKNSGRISDSAEDLGALANTLILWIKEFKDKSELAPILVKILSDSRRMARGSESAFESVSGNVGVLEDRTLSRHFVSRTSLNLKQQSIDLLQKTVKKLGGTGNNLNTDERKRAKIDDPYNYEIFLDVLKQIRNKSRRFGRSWVRMHSDDDGLVDYQQFVSAVSKEFRAAPLPGRLSRQDGRHVPSVHQQGPVDGYGAVGRHHHYESQLRRGSGQYLRLQGQAGSSRELGQAVHHELQEPLDRQAIQDGRQP